MMTQEALSRAETQGSEHITIRLFAASPRPRAQVWLQSKAAPGWSRIWTSESDFTTQATTEKTFVANIAHMIALNVVRMLMLEAATAAQVQEPL
jgi:hypothetical protein